MGILERESVGYSSVTREGGLRLRGEGCHSRRQVPTMQGRRVEHLDLLQRVADSVLPRIQQSALDASVYSDTQTQINQKNETRNATISISNDNNQVFNMF